MYIKTPKNVDLADISVDIDTALSLARALYGNYFEEAPKDEDKKAFANYFFHQRNTIGTLIGAIIDYTRSAQALIDAFEEQQETAKNKS